MAPLQHADQDAMTPASPPSLTSPVGRIGSPASMHPSLSASLNSYSANATPSQQPSATDSKHMPFDRLQNNTLSELKKASVADAGTASASADRTPTRSGRASPPGHLHIPKMPSMAQVALSAMQYLPTPLIVLSGLKTVIFANDAMGKLLGLDQMYAAEQQQQQQQQKSAEHDLPHGFNVTDRLIGQSLGQIGIDLLQDGQPVWVNWERFLDGLTRRSNDRLATSSHATSSIEVNEDIRSLAREASVEPSGPDAPQSPTSKRKRPKLDGDDGEGEGETAGAEAKTTDRSFVQDTVVDVLLSSQYVGVAMNSRDAKSLAPFRHVQARMVISIWSMDGQQYYSLAFSAATPSALSSSRSQIRMTAARTPTTSSSPSSAGSLRGAVTSAPRCSHCGTSNTSNASNNAFDAAAVAATPPPRTSPSEQPLSIAPFPLTHTSSVPSALQRTLKLKDAIINGMQIPKFAMWKDESIVVPNKAAEHLMRRHTDPTSDETLDPLSRFQAYTDDFSRKLELEENPIVLLCRTQKPFKSIKVGYLDRKGKRIVYDVSGECLYDENDEFIGGITALKDVTEFADKIREQSDRNEQQFELICDCMPQIAWTTTPVGGHDWFSRRWYEYTGLTEGQSLGEQWANVFHPEDMPETARRWRHSLATGDEYVTEYRARSSTGEWRWMLGRALPLRDHKTGAIVKWFGTCTDIHDLVEARQEQKRTHDQLLKVIDHAKVTVWSIDRQKILTFLEGPLQFINDADRDSRKKLIGYRIEEAFGKQAGSYDLRKYVDPIEKILKNQLGEHVVEHHIEGTDRWFRTRFVPIHGVARPDGAVDKNYVDGVVGVSQDVSEVKMRELELQNTEKENIRLISAETAAKEASRLKSQFLANMSHEIRTPIAGVIGMAELLVDTPLDDDQRELAENIQRSANGLLTVINDILDLSKVESGRLEIESVQFNLSLVLRDVGKMMSFAAGQKALSFDQDFRVGEGGDADTGDRILIGDPNRCRQILTNLLTNSIKFTQDGSVKLAAWVESETADTLSVTFAVEDTGQGIEEEVKKKLFKPFTQADSSTARRFGGTGLGLTICKNLVHLMKGSIRLDSVLGQGTKARFTIPFTKPQNTDRDKPLVDLGFPPDRFHSQTSISGRGSSDHNNTPPQTPLDPSRPGSISSKRIPSMTGVVSGTADPSSLLPAQDRQAVHILVVEDNPVNQQIATRTIKKLGFSVHAVDNGKKALEYILNSAAGGGNDSTAAGSSGSKEVRKPNVILMDVQMPVLDGYRATHQIRHHDPFKSLPGMNNVPIVAMTASAIQGDKEKCQRAGMDDYLAKPVKSTVLEQMLVKWAIRNRKGQSAVAGPNAAARGGATITSQSDHDSNCTETDVVLNSVPAFNQPTHAQPQPTRGSRLAASPSFPDVMSPPPESEGDRGLRRQAAEEKAQALRDDKLVSAAESDEDAKRPRIGRSKTSSAVVRPSIGKVKALTEENLVSMNRERATGTSSDQSYDRVQSDGRSAAGNKDIKIVVEEDDQYSGVATRGSPGTLVSNTTPQQRQQQDRREESLRSPTRPNDLVKMHEESSSGDSLRTNADFVKVGLEVPSEDQGLPKSGAGAGTSATAPKGGKQRLKTKRFNSANSEKTVRAWQGDDEEEEEEDDEEDEQ